MCIEEGASAAGPHEGPHRVVASAPPPLGSDRPRDGIESIRFWRHPPGDLWRMPERLSAAGAADVRGELVCAARGVLVGDGRPSRGEELSGYRALLGRMQVQHSNGIAFTFVETVLHKKPDR